MKSGYLSGLILVWIWFWLTIALHLAYTKSGEILEHLKHCSAIRIRAPLRSMGIPGRLLLIGGISGIVTFPKTHLRRGELCAQDLQQLPRSLRRRLIALQWGLISSVAALFLGLVIKALGWLS
jgi:hypothetical protein